MKYRPLKEVINIPKVQDIKDAHMGVEFDYIFMGDPQGKEGVHLLVETKVIDHFENQYIRRTEHLVLRKDVKDCIRSRIREHLLDTGVDNVQINGLMRDFEVENSNYRPFERWRTSE